MTKKEETELAQLRAEVVRLRAVISLIRDAALAPQPHEIPLWKQIAILTEPENINKRE